MFGAHRYYVGKIGTGVIWTLTAGFFGIGWIVDIFTVALGGFYDANGYVVRFRPTDAELRPKGWKKMPPLTSARSKAKRKGPPGFSPGRAFCLY